MESYPWSKAIVVGASSGIGEQISRQLAAAGARVALVGRREDRLQTICAEINRDAASETAFAVPHDVRDRGDLSALFQQITGRLAGLDLVVYVAGTMPRVGPQEYPTEVDRDTIETNFTGAIVWLNEAATRFARAGEGTIVGISSVAGDRGRRGNPVYGATKAALGTYLESLRNRLSVRNVTVTTVKPGYVRTAQVEGLVLPRIFPVVGPEDAAREILAAAAAGKGIVYIPSWWRFVMTAIRAVPPRIMQRLNI
jgi:decaprenylphospho-beta-D-erythro-pentofuranosid-2-ulose 2-reductase